MTNHSAPFDASSFYGSFRREAARLGLDAAALLPPDRISLYGTIDSTNSELLRRLEGGDPLLAADGTLTKRGRELNGTLVASAAQSAGRGRIGRRFYSPPGGGIYFSFLAVPEGGVGNPARYTVTAAVAVCRAVESLYGIRSGIKWVNDVYVGEKKVCGILTEGFSPAAPGTEGSPAVQAAILGIGINLRTDGSLPQELAGKAGGIAEQAILLGCPPERAASVSRQDLLASCMAHILRLLPAGNGGKEKGPWGDGIWEEYASRSILTGREVTVIPLVGDASSGYRAEVTGIGRDFSLLVRTDDGQERKLTSGEVSLRL